MQEYLALFLDESKDHIQSLNDNLLFLEKDMGNIAIINEMFRSAHTLKGMSATMGFTLLADITHKMENIMDLVRNKKLNMSQKVLDTFFDTVGVLEKIISNIESNGNDNIHVGDIVIRLKSLESMDIEIEEENIGELVNIKDLNEVEMNTLKEAYKQGFSSYYAKVELSKDVQLKSVRVFMVLNEISNFGEIIKTYPSVDILEKEDFGLDFEIIFITKEDINSLKEKVLNITDVHSVEVEKIEESHFIKEENNSEVTELVNVQEKQNENQKDKKDSNVKVDSLIRVSTKRLDMLLTYFEELVINKGVLENIIFRYHDKDLEDVVNRISQVTGRLQEVVLNIRMTPLEQVFNRFPRMVRQLSKDLGKKVEFIIEGSETELDRGIIDEISDPLVHLIRNSLDHGIEKPDVRVARGKNEVGELYLRAYYKGNNVCIEIEDDGGGINKEKVIAKAIEKGIISEEDVSLLSDKDVFQLIFSSGFSTADTITDISGRGVGLDVVKTVFESLGGFIDVESEEGKGTKFSIYLPLTLSIMDCMLVDVGLETYAIPIANIVEVSKLSNENVFTMNGLKVLDFRGKVIPLIFLGDKFNVGDEVEHSFVVVVAKGDQLYGLVVSALRGQSSIVVKPLSKYLGDVVGISGATILGDGRVVLIIDTSTLVK